MYLYERGEHYDGDGGGDNSPFEHIIMVRFCMFDQDGQTKRHCTTKPSVALLKTSIIFNI